MKIYDIINENINNNPKKNTAEGQIDEVSQDWNERWNAGKKLNDLFYKKYKKGNFTLQDLELATSLVKISGRAFNVGRSGYQKYTAGNILDDIVNIIREKDIAAGKTPELTRAPSTREMAKQIAQVTNGRAAWRSPTVWTTNYGDRYKDPKDHVEYSDEEAYNDAWQFLLSKGKQVHYKESGHLHTAIQIGSYLIEPSSRTKGYFSDNPETTHSISVRTVKSLGGHRQKQDISDQQAATLKDIAQTKNANDLAKLKAIMAVFQGEQDIKNVIANSQKIDPRDKAKLDSIIAGAKDFKEPSDQQGVAEGLGSYDNDKGIRHTRESLVAKLEALPKGSEEFEWHKNRAIYHLQQGNMLRAKYYMALMKRGEQGVAEGRLDEDLQADDGEYYKNADKFFSQFEADWFDDEVTSPDGMEIRGYIDGVNVMAWRYKSAKKIGGWGIYDDSSLDNQGVAEGSKWRSNPDAHDINDDGEIYPKTRDMFAYDPLSRRQSTAGDARTARGKKAALKTSLKMAQGRHGPKGQLPEQQGVAEGEYDDPRWEPREPDMSRKVDWDIEAERNRPEEAESDMVVYIIDNETNEIVLKFRSTGEYWGDVKHAAKHGYDTDGDRFDIKWKRKKIEENATIGATSAGNVAVGAVYKNKPAKQAKNKDGTAKNALDMKANLLTGGSIKR